MTLEYYAGSDSPIQWEADQLKLFHGSNRILIILLMNNQIYFISNLFWSVTELL